MAAPAFPLLFDAHNDLPWAARILCGGDWDALGLATGAPTHVEEHAIEAGVDPEDHGALLAFVAGYSERPPRSVSKTWLITSTTSGRSRESSTWVSEATSTGHRCCLTVCTTSAAIPVSSTRCAKEVGQKRPDAAGRGQPASRHAGS